MTFMQRVSKCNPLAEFQPNWERYVDRGLLVALFVLMGLGFVVMVSASVAVAQKTYGNPYHFLNRQVIFLIMFSLKLTKYA